MHWGNTLSFKSCYYYWCPRESAFITKDIWIQNILKTFCNGQSMKVHDRENYAVDRLPTQSNITLSGYTRQIKCLTEKCRDKCIDKTYKYASQAAWNYISLLVWFGHINGDQLNEFNFFQWIKTRGVHTQEQMPQLWSKSMKYILRFNIELQCKESATQNATQC